MGRGAGAALSVRLSAHAEGLPKWGMGKKAVSLNNYQKQGNGDRLAVRKNRIVISKERFSTGVGSYLFVQFHALAVHLAFYFDFLGRIGIQAEGEHLPGAQL